MGRKQLKYTPLRLVDEHSRAIQEFEEARALRTIGGAEDEVIAAIDYAVTRICEQNGIVGRRITKAEENTILCQSYDHAIATVIAYYWSKCKQVYTFSRDFYEMLLDMEDFEIGWSLFDYLPYETFYLELLDHKEIDGVFVKYTKGPSPSILYTICGKEGRMLSINSGIVDPRDNLSYKSFFETEVHCSNVDMNAPYVVLVKKILAFTLQACMYLCAKNADIEENPIQKKIYTPSQTIRNRFSEIQKWDVGVRVVREHKAARALSMESYDAYDLLRHRPRKHWRKAHFHTYWVGKGRTKKELKFIAPILVNDNDDEMPVVIHE